MRIKPTDIFSSYSRFRGELVNELEKELKGSETMESNRRLHGADEQLEMGNSQLKKLM